MVEDELTPLDPTPYLPLIRAALEEDHAHADLTAQGLVPEDRMGTADVIAKAEGVVAGMPLVEPIFQTLDARCRVETEFEDGDLISQKHILFTVHGPARAILAGERIALNFLARLCGVATITRDYVEGTMATGARIHDTRKTTPGWRDLEKHAVRCGGGFNHRLHLEDAAMIKENHLKAAFGKTGPEAIRAGVTQLRASLPEGKRLYCEVESHEEMLAAAEAGADVMMLDDFELGDIRRAVKAIRAMPPPHPLIEITGGVTLGTLEAYAAAGAQRISVGALTHSAKALDLSMQMRTTQE